MVHLQDHLEKGDLLVLNDTRVIRARVFGVRPDTSGRVEFLFLDIADGSATALVKTRSKVGEGITARLGEESDGITLRVGPLLPGGVHRVETDLTRDAMVAALERLGRMPLPPYIHRDKVSDPRDPIDQERYQTVYSQSPGAAAAPTAGLHFTNNLLRACAERGVEVATVTLHVGLGTFRPVEQRDIRLHQMHEERFSVPESTAQAIAMTRARGGRVIAVGTTALRALAAAMVDGVIRGGEGTTRVFMHPPHRINVVDGLLTNFHVPKSTLFMLVCAFGGTGVMKRAYAHAIAARYRLLSYGDAMLILASKAPNPVGR